MAITFSRIGTYAQTNNLVYMMLQNQKQFDNTATQLTTGLKSQVWSGYAQQIPRLTSLTEQSQNANLYLENIKTVETRAALGNTALSAVISQATSFQRLISTPVPALTGLEAEDARRLNEYATNMSQQAVAVMSSIADLLNSQDSSRYLMSGSNVTTPAVTILNPGTNPPVDNAAVNAAYTFGSTTAAAANSNAGYHFQINSTGTASQTQVQIDTNTFSNPQIQLSTNPNRTPWTLATQPPFDNGGVPNNSPFKRLLDGLAEVADLGTTLLPGITATPASTATGFANITAAMNTARQALSDAISGNASPPAAISATGIQSMQSMATSISVATQSAGYAKISHQQFVTSSTNAIADILQVDTVETAAKLNAQQTQLQASYSALSKVTSLSLLNYM